MVGADFATFRRAEPVLAAFGTRIEHVGPVGAGHAVKAVNNAFLAVNLLAAGEGLAALVKAGVPAGTALAVINASSGRSFVTEVLIPERVLTGDYPQTFRLALLDKDVAIACDFARETGVSAPMLDLAGRLLSQARTRLGEEADHVETIRLMEEKAGVQIRG
jgi:3-hydroxyisobutyrate dehydrogenase